MRTRLAVLPLVLTASLGVAGCSGGGTTTVTDEGVVETPTTEPNGGAGVDARSGDPLAPSDPTDVPSPEGSPAATPSS